MKTLLGGRVQSWTLPIGSLSTFQETSRSPVQAAQIGTHRALLSLNAIPYAPHSRYL